MKHTVYQHGTGGPALYWFCGANEDVQAFASLVRARCAALPFLLVACHAESWNADLSPWPAPPVFGDEGFSGGGRATLDWLLAECVPQVTAQFGARPQLIGGYSLAGLFSLWAFYETGMFRGAASCSGSLWFPGWDNHAATFHAPPQSLLYLSLGTKEEHTRHPVMQRVGDATRAQDARAAADSALARHILHWNPGGHFADPAGRTAAGFAWLLQELSVPRTN